ncbi:MAG: hypothetical protein ACSHX4_10480 [Opitutaceae bacterium]
MRLLFLFFILTCSVSGRIGETPNQLKKRYDTAQPLSFGETVVSEGRILKFGKLVVYKSEGWTITATFINDKCERIIYKKAGSWTDEQVYAILKANANGQTWSRSKPFSEAHKLWIGIGSSTAYWHSISGMDMKTNAYFTYIEKLKKEAARKSKEVPNF